MGFGHDIGSSFLMMSLQYPRVSRRLKGLITANMALDSSKFSARSWSAWAWKRVRKALFAAAPRGSELQIGFKPDNLRIKGLDPPRHRRKCQENTTVGRTF